MADLQATGIMFDGDPHFGRVTLPKKTAGDDIQIGDFLVSDGSNGVEKVDAAADDATFVGVSGTLSADANGPSLILVYLKCVVMCPMESAGYNFGAPLKFNTNGTLEADGGATTMAWAWETKGSATSLRVLVDAPALLKKFAVNT